MQYLIAVRNQIWGKHCSELRALHKGKSNQRLGKRSGKLSDSCMHVVVGDGLSVCQSRYFCLFSAALLAARDTPHVIAGCLLSLAKKERGSGVCVCVCVSERESDREKLEQLSWKLLYCQYISNLPSPDIALVRQCFSQLFGQSKSHLSTVNKTQLWKWSCVAQLIFYFHST